MTNLIKKNADKISKLVAIAVVALFVFSACSDSEIVKHPNLQDENFL